LLAISPPPVLRPVEGLSGVPRGAAIDKSG
jgi:hypothetical protein